MHACILFIPVCVASSNNNSTMSIWYETGYVYCVTYNLLSIVIDLEFIFVIDVHYNMVPSSFKSAVNIKQSILKSKSKLRQSSSKKKRKGGRQM